MSSNCIEQAGQNYIKWFYENNRVDKDNLPPTRGEFINKLLTDDEFYEKWGNGCCEEITTIEMCEMFGVDYDKVTEWSYHGKNLNRDLEVRTMLTDPDVGPNYPKRKLNRNGKS